MQEFSFGDMTVALQLGQPPTLSHLLYTDYGPGYDKVGRPLVDRYGHLRNEPTDAAVRKGKPSKSSEPVKSAQSVSNTSPIEVLLTNSG